MRTITTILLFCTVAVAQNLPDAPQPRSEGDAPHLTVRRPTIASPDHPDGKPERHKWAKRAALIGSAASAAKLADDSCDFIIGPAKARYVGAAAAVTTFLIVHHYLRPRKTSRH